MSSSSKSDNELLQDISRKLTHLIGIFGIQGKDRVGQVSFLVGLGYTNAEIAQMTGIPKGTVDGIRAGRKGEPN